MVKPAAVPSAPGPARWIPNGHQAAPEHGVEKCGGGAMDVGERSPGESATELRALTTPRVQHPCVRFNLIMIAAAAALGCESEPLCGEVRDPGGYYCNADGRMTSLEVLALAELGVPPAARGAPAVMLESSGEVRPGRLPIERSTLDVDGGDIEWVVSYAVAEDWDGSGRRAGFLPVTVTAEGTSIGDVFGGHECPADAEISPVQDSTSLVRETVRRYEDARGTTLRLGVQVLTFVNFAPCIARDEETAAAVTVWEQPPREDPFFQSRFEVLFDSGGGVTTTVER